MGFWDSQSTFEVWFVPLEVILRPFTERAAPRGLEFPGPAYSNALALRTVPGLLRVLLSFQTTCSQPVYSPGGLSCSGKVCRALSCPAGVSGELQLVVRTMSSLQGLGFPIWSDICRFSLYENF